MSESQTLKEFTESFFKQLGTKILWNGDYLIADKVPKEFEEFYGKKSPYTIVFEREKENESTELITKGSFLLKAMTSYLDTRGQTTLLKISTTEPSEFIRSKIDLKNCEISNLIKSIIYKTISKFTFLTIFQYLNEKEQKIWSIYIYEGKNIPFLEKDFDFSEGKKEEIETKDIKESYLVAKESLKSSIRPRIDEIAKELEAMLSKEIERITLHYSQQNKEIEHEISNIKKQITELEKSLVSFKDKESITLKIKKLEENLKKVSLEDKKGKLEKEKEFFIADEIHKHGLSIDTKLINTTLIYYPLYSCNFSFRNSGSISKSVDVSFNSLDKEISELNCESCSLALNSLTLCSSGHISCEKCLEACLECSGFSCKLCKINSCDRCGRRICRKCLKKCSICNKHLCKSHLSVSSLGKDICSECSKPCRLCKKATTRQSMKKCSSCGSEFCLNCSQKEITSLQGRILCSSCIQKCSTCGKALSKDNFMQRKECQCRGCSDLRRCLSCRKMLCVKKRHDI